MFGFNIFDAIDKLTSNIFLPLAGLLTSLFVGWILGPKAVGDITKDTEFSWYHSTLLFCIRYLVPFFIALILYLGVF